MKITKRQLRKVIRESILLKESKEELVTALNNYDSDWDSSDEEILEFFMNEGEHLIDYLTDVKTSELNMRGQQVLEMLMNEFFGP